MSTANRLDTVTRDNWCVAYVSSSLKPGVVELSVFRGFINGEPVKGEHDGRQFPTVEAAQRFALEHGYVQLYQPKEVKR